MAIETSLREDIHAGKAPLFVKSHARPVFLAIAMAMFNQLGGMVVCHAFGQGAVIWVFISEIFPTAVRSKGQTLGSFTHWFMAMLVSWTFPLVARELGQPHAGLPFAFFAAMMVVQLFVVGLFFPETKQVASASRYQTHAFSADGRDRVTAAVRQRIELRTCEIIRKSRARVEKAGWQGAREGASPQRAVTERATPPDGLFCSRPEGCVSFWGSSLLSVGRRYAQLGGGEV
ncbi:MAG: MFS transporter, partial [Verrucomicrobiia bacterium]